jgi:hypothetical protein
MKNLNVKMKWPDEFCHERFLNTPSILPSGAKKDDGYLI